ncbi:MAG: hypothetical protein ACOCY1_02450 [Halovenus sp.]
MHERLPAVDSDGVLRGRPFGVAAFTSAILLCLLVTAAGIAAIYARSVGTWEALFYMERFFAFAVPTVKVLLTVSLVSGTVFLWRR